MSNKIRHSNRCPYCDSTMKVRAMECPVCDVEIRGEFRQPLFHLLDSEEQDILEKYLLSEFNIKKLEQETGMGYAAIRSRLDKIIAHYRHLRDADDSKKRILKMVAEGKLTASEAAERISKL